MAKLYRVLDHDGDCIFNVIVKSGETAISVIPNGDFNVVASDYDGTPLQPASGNKFAGWEVTLETEDFIADDDSLGSAACAEFGSLSRIQLTFTQKGGVVTPLFRARKPKN